MTILSDIEINKLCLEFKMLDPYQTELVNKDGSGNRLISYGQSSYGYDVRLSNKFKIFTNVNSSIIDPKALDDKCMMEVETNICIIPPNSYVLGYTEEVFNMPRDVTAVCLSKSTYARSGISVNPTVIEAGFSGQVVLEFFNATTLPAKLYAGEGAAQFLFFKGSVPCQVSYADRGGKYQGQRGLQLPLV